MRGCLGGLMVAVAVAAGWVGVGAARGQEAARKDAPALTSMRRPRPFATAETPRKAERVRTFDVRHVKGELRLDGQANGGAGEIRGTVTHTVAPLYSGLATLTLDCGAELKVGKVSIASGPGAAKPASFKQVDNTLVVSLDPPLPAGTAFDLAVTYAGTPRQGLYLVPPDAAEPGRPLCFWTQGEPDETRHWLPCYDFPNDRATSEMIVTVPKPLRVLSNGSLVGTKENADGTTTDHWRMDVPHVSYLISLVATEFTIAQDRHGELPVDYYLTRDHDEATARRALGKTPAMIAFFEKVTGQRYPYPKYAQAVVPSFTQGGMENISATTLNEFALGDAISSLERDADSLVAHELAHQWFGDLLTCRDWPHLWLNEGFASYFDPLFTEHDKGDDAFRLRMDGIIRSYLAGDTFQRRALVEPRYRNTLELFDGVTYAKGAAVLHTLRGLVGDDAWWKAIKRYVATHRESVVETDDLRRTFEAVTGRDLGWFFEQWTAKGGHPELKARWRYEPDDRTVRLTVEQNQNLNELTPLFRLPTTVEIDDGQHVATTAVVIDGKVHEFVIPFAGASASASPPKMVRLDPKGWIIKELDFDKPVGEWVYQLEHARDLPGRLDAARALAKPAVKDDAQAIAALGAAWSRETDESVRQTFVQLIAAAPEKHRAALRNAATDPSARVRIAALQGLSTLAKAPDLEALYRAAWSNAKEAYSARRIALRTLARWKVSDRDDLIATALKTPSDHHTIASAALDLLLEDTGRKGREAAVAYSRAGQPAPLRRSALFTLARLAQDDPTLQPALFDLVSDPSRSIRRSVWMQVSNRKYKGALAALEAQLPRETVASSRTALESTIATLKEAAKTTTPVATASAGAAAKPVAKPASSTSASASASSSNSGSAAASTSSATHAAEVAELERKAADLEFQVKELRNKAEALRLQDERARRSSASATK